MNLGSANKAKPSRGNYHVIIKSKSLPRLDRHVFKIDKIKFDLSPSSSSEKSTSSYQSSLQKTIMNKKSFREFAADLLYNRQNFLQTDIPHLRSPIPTKTFRIHGWRDDYYTSLLDWSWSNFLCGANKMNLYFYNMTIDDHLQSSMCRIYRLQEHNQVINSIKFSPRNNNIAVCYSRGMLKSYDFLKQKTTISKKSYHRQRIAAIQWEGNLIFTGSKDRQIKAFDPKINKISQKFQNFFSQQICGLRSNGTLLACGGNNNYVGIYDLRKAQKILYSYEHEAAVKALDWILPNTLISGGGTADRKLKFWKDGLGVWQNIDTGSQVCGLKYSSTTNQIVTCQGFSLNQIIVWNLAGNRQLTIHGHSERVMYSCLSPSGEFLATGAGDEQLKVWKLFRKKAINQFEMSQLR